MKKVLLALLLSCLTFISVRAAPLLYEGFNYADGSITTNSGGTWIRHSGSAAAPGDAIVHNHRLENSATGGTLSRQDDVHTNITSQAGIVYASFTVNCTNLPNALGTYFAHFYVNSSTFYGRVFALVGNGGPNIPTNFTAQPKTFRLGIAGAAGAATKVFPADLAMNTDYQVVVGWNGSAGLIDNVPSDTARLWVNPLSSTDTGVNSSDSVATPSAVVGYGFRQASSFGNAFFAITNLAVDTTFSGAATAVWSATPVAPVIVYQPQSTNVLTGNTATLAAVATGQSLADLTYQWQKNDGSGNYTNIDVSFNPTATANVLTIPGVSASDAGQYRLTVTNPTSLLFATSQPATVSVHNQVGPDQICGQPTNTTVFYGQTATLSVCAVGEPGDSYQWYYNTVSNYSGSAIDGVTVGTNDTGQTSAVLNIANVRPANTTTGYYYCIVTAFNTQTTNTAIVQVSAIPVPAVSIYELRGMVDGTFYLPTNTTALWQATGTVTTYTNLTAAPNMSIVIQDATAGIGVFFGGNAANLPQAGDSITVIGSLGNFNSALQLNISAADPSNLLITNSHNNPLPTPYVLPLSFTNGIGFGGVSNVVRKYVGALVTFPNVGFTDAGGTFGTGQLTEIITNTCGDNFRVFFNAAASGVVSGQPVPTFPVSVTGPMSYFLTATAPDRSTGFELDPTRYVDIVSGATLLPVTISSIGSSAVTYGGGAGAQFVLLQSPDVTQSLGSWTRAQTNCGSPGSFTISTTGPGMFYRIKSE